MKSQKKPAEIPTPDQVPEIEPSELPEINDPSPEEPAIEPEKEPDIIPPTIPPEEQPAEPSPPEFPSP